MKSPQTIPVSYDPFRDGEIEFTVPSTASQQEIWTSIQLAEDARLAFNESVSVAIPARLDPEVLRKALFDLVATHDALRSCFSPLGRTLLIAAPKTPELRITDLSRASDPEAAIAQARREACQEPFDLVAGHMLRASLLLQSSRSLLILTAHHVICDGWSLAILIKDLARFYTLRSQGLTPPPASGMNFSDYAKRAAAREGSAEDQKNESYWQEQFKTLPPPMDLPLQSSRPTFRTFNSQRLDIAIEASLWTKSKQFSARLGSSHLGFMLSLFQLLLSKLSGQQDVVCGIPAAGQSILGAYGLVGHCVNLLPIRLSLSADESFAQVLQRMKKTLLDAYDHQEYTYGSLLQKLRIERDPARLPIVSVLFNIDQQLESKDLNFAGYHAHYESNPRFAENFELFVNISESKERVILECQYNTDLFSAELVQSFFQGYLSLLEQVMQNLEQPLRRLSLLDSPERIFAWNQTKASYPEQQTLDQILLPLLAQRGEAVVCRSQKAQLSAQALRQMSFDWAELLRQQGVQPGDRVGLCMSRSPAMLAAVLAIWQVRAAYVPLDPSFPLDRLHFMIEDAGIRVCLSQSDLLGLLPSGVHGIATDAAAPLQAAPQDMQRSPEDLAYVIYTSGSTGRPKGVMIQHRPLINFLFAVQKQLELSPSDSLLAVTTMSFDISILELYLPLLTGSSLYIASSEEARDGGRLQEIIAEERISCMQATPSTWRVLLASGLRPVRELQALCGGEAFPQELARDLLPLCHAVWNMYGPTEATVWASMFRVTSGDKPILIGRPLANYQLYVLDSEGALQPPGVKGELYIGGEGLASGYLNRPELTAERFRSFPHLAVGHLYMTGDVARFTFDGQLEIFGRSDDQVKVRGYRIELGEIEKVLAAHPLVKVAVVIVREDLPGDKRLVAYFEARRPLALEVLRSFVAETLPEYMVPQHFVAIDRLPLLPNGKMDRKSLPAPQLAAAVGNVGQAFTPADAFESEFAAIWTSSLGLGAVSRQDNFFLVGGHSLLAIQMVARLNREMKMQLQMRDVFVHPQFEQLLQVARQQAGRSASGPLLQKRAPAERAEISLLQKRMWYLEQLDPESRVHNLPGAWEIVGALDPQIFAAATAQLLDRHEAMRSTLLTRGDGTEVLFHPESWQPDLIDLSGQADARRLCQADMDARALEKIPLDTFPLFRCALYRLSPESHILFFMVHHAIWDGWSFDLFLKELGLHYRKLSTGQTVELPPLPVQYYDFAAWHKKSVESGGSPEDLKFWLKTLTPVPEALEIPTDFPRPPLQSHKGLTLSFRLNEDEIKACEALARHAKVTLFSLFLACYKVILQRYARQFDVVVGVPLRGRQQSELEHILGLFINVLPVRTQLRTDESFISLAQRVHQNCLDAFAHGDMLLETIVAALNLKRDDSRTPLYSTMFSYQDVSDRVQTLDGRELKQLGVSSHVVHTDQMLWMKKGSASLDGGIDFRTDLWDVATMESFRDCFCATLKLLSKEGEKKLATVDVLPLDLRRRVLEQQSSSPALAGLRPLSQLLDLSLQRGDREALVAGSQRLSYASLEASSQRMASFLHERGVRAGDKIGICLHRQQDLIIAMLAVLRVGAAYVPMDPLYPAERLAFMLEHAAVRLVLSESDLVDFVPPSGATVIALDQVAWQEARASLSTLSPSDENKLPAYLIYTSGSTGQPKGVILSRAALANFLWGMTQTLQLTREDRMLALTTISFDISILEIFGGLSLGATVVLIDQETSLDGDELARVLETERVSVMQATPASWRLLLAADWPGRRQMKAICGGEALPKDLAIALVGRCQELWNAYGPTEATVWATVYRVEDPQKPILIGRPLPGYRAYILDEQQRVQPPGVWGNLFLGGQSLADGYYRQPELTAERFVPNPFVGGESIYDTGDIARFRWDGQLEFSSRRDNQVKVRGFRIELGEIETHLSEHSAVEKAVVIVREDRKDDKRLVAYVVCHQGQTLQLGDMHKHLSLKLPKYMLPNHLVLLDRLPLTDNGKVDRKALPLPQEAQVEEGEAPRTEAEKIVAFIWKELLQVHDVRREQMFFDLGGHSLLSIQAVNRINQMSGRALKLRDLLTGTLAQVAALCHFVNAPEQLAQLEGKSLPEIPLAQNAR